MRLTFDDTKPIFQQIAEMIEDDIVNGVLKEGDQIPSTIQLVAHYKINPATILKEFNQLVDAGIVYKNRGVGMFEMSVPSFMEEGSQTSVASLLENSSRIFFLVCGILSMSGFFKYFVSMGITRKAYFKGNVLGIFMLAISFTLATAVLYGIESFIFSGYENSFGQMALFFVKMAFDIVLFFLIGWFIAVGFYRNNVVKGVGFILISIAVLFIQSGIWGEALPLAFLSTVSIQNFSPILIMVISAVIIAALIYFIRQLTKNVTVRA